jgi:hypothetical protein
VNRDPSGVHERSVLFKTEHLRRHFERIATQICPANRTQAWSRSTKCTAFRTPSLPAKANLSNSSAWHPEDACSGNTLVLIRWQDRDVAEFRIHETSRNLPGDWM